MQDSMTTRRRNGKAMSFSIADEEGGWGEYRCLSASVNKACGRWLENKFGYTPSFGGMRYGKPKTSKRKKTNENSPNL